MNENKLTVYENNQLAEIRKFQNEKPSVVSEGLSLIGKPLEMLTSLLIPEKVMQAILNGANATAEFLADEGDIIRDGKVNAIEELRNKDLKLSDELANEVHNWAIAAAVAEGGATGMMGAAGIAADIPAVLTLALRTIHKIGLCYGYKAYNLEEKEYVLRVMSLAGSNSMKEKNQVLLQLKMVEATLRKNAMWVIERKASKDMAKKAVSNELIIKLIKDLCKQLGINFSKRKAMQVIPLFGAGVGAAMNGSFIRDIGYAARRQYQERWLIDNGKIIDV